MYHKISQPSKTPFLPFLEHTYSHYSETKLEAASVHFVIALPNSILPSSTVDRALFLLEPPLRWGRYHVSTAAAIKANTGHTGDVGDYARVVCRRAWLEEVDDFVEAKLEGLLAHTTLDSLLGEFTLLIL
jgi:hypothetical protein